MGQPKEHRYALAAGRGLGRLAARPPEDHRVVLLQERRKLQQERQRWEEALHVHRQTLERVREQLAQERTFHRKAYEQNRWWIELLLRWWEARGAA
jgi:hypothetical protein